MAPPPLGFPPTVRYPRVHEHDLNLLVVGAALEAAAVAAIVFVPELLDFLQTLMSSDSWPGER
jgi:hypothetical protein